MDQSIGRVEADVEPAVALRAAILPDNVVPLSLAARASTAAREPDIHELFDALPAAIYTTDAAGRLTYFNDAAAALWGRRPALGSEWCGSWKLYRPDGTPMPHAECPMAIALKEKRPVRSMVAIAERPDGTRVAFIPNPTPLFDEAGILTGAINMLVDISERKRAEEEQALLVRELHHRVKNTLATVQAIVGSTARSARSIDEFKEALNGRIGSLARTHLLLSEEPQDAVSFVGMLHNELDAFDDGSGGRIGLTGPPVEIPTRLAVALGMAIHELATNAARHGALSVYGGKVTACWRVTIEATRRTLEFDWVESGGPSVKPPTRCGFGTRLLEVVMPNQVQARGRIDYAPTGVRVHYEVPMALC